MRIGYDDADSLLTYPDPHNRLFIIEGVGVVCGVGRVVAG